MLREIQSNVGKYLKLSLSVAIGSAVHGITEIKHSWNSAYNGSHYRIVFGTGCLIISGVEETRESLLDDYSSVLEKQVMDSLKLGDLTKTRSAVDEYTAALRNAPYDEMMLLLTQLLIATARTAKAMATADIEEFRMDISYLGQQLYKWETLEQIKEWYMDLCEKTVSLRDRQSSQKNWLIVDKIKQYIHQHYADPSLTVETLVEVGGLSTNYMRKVFKDISSQSINVYLSECRFEKAKELLVETDYPANKIGEMVGFENSNYFYVSFKKYCGKTPDHFRKHNKYKALDDQTGSN